MEPVESRYEFRCFVSPMEPLPPATIQAMGDVTAHESREIYAVSALGTGVNLKYRNGEMDLKRLLAVDGDLEQWSPGERTSFPVAHEWLTEVLALGLGIGDALASAPESVTAPMLFEELLRTVPGVGLADVRKARRIFEHADCRAEHAMVHINGAAIVTLCVESTDPNAVRAARASLGLSGHENTSYPTAIARIMGLSPVPLHY